MELDKTNRGFDISEFEELSGHTCSLQKSSSAMQDCIWFGIDKPQKITVFEDDTKHRYTEIPKPKNWSIYTRMHLNQEMVRELLPYLENFVKTGDLGENEGCTWGNMIVDKRVFSLPAFHSKSIEEATTNTQWLQKLDEQMWELEEGDTLWLTESEPDGTLSWYEQEVVEIVDRHNLTVRVMEINSLGKPTVVRGLYELISNEEYKKQNKQ